MAWSSCGFQYGFTEVRFTFYRVHRLKACGSIAVASVAHGAAQQSQSILELSQHLRRAPYALVPPNAPALQLGTCLLPLRTCVSQALLVRGSLLPGLSLCLRPVRAAARVCSDGRVTFQRADGHFVFILRCGGRFRCFHFGAVVNSATASVCVQVVWT